MDIVVQVRDDVARLLHGRVPRGQESEDSEELRAALQRLGIRLVPMHPAADDPTLMSFFTVSGASQQQSRDVIATLQKLPGVEAAYAKPPAELP